MLNRGFALIGLAALLTWPATAFEALPVNRVVEIRCYNLKAGMRDRFHQLLVQQALPMLQRAKVDVVAYGPSLHDNDRYYLMRSYASLEDRQRSEDAFYGSAEWREGPRAAVLAVIENYTTVVVRLDDATLRGLRGSMKENAMPTETALSADLAILLELNQDYIHSVQTSDVRRFQEILAEDFLCSLPDGSLIDRATFLEQTAVPVKISKLMAHDVNVRIMGDFAIIHASTTYTTADGRSAAGRYTDVWARRNGRWLAVSAHVTRN